MRGRENVIIDREHYVTVLRRNGWSLARALEAYQDAVAGRLARGANVTSVPPVGRFPWRQLAQGRRQEVIQTLAAVASALSEDRPGA